MSDKATSANKITAHIKGLGAHLQEHEEPLLNLPGIWDNGQQQHSTMCEVILTNQRLFGYYYKTFPRKQLFLDALNVAEITNVSLRQKSHEPLFRELLVEAGTRKVYVRASRSMIEALYTELQKITVTSQSSEAAVNAIVASVPGAAGITPSYGREQIHTPFDNSPLAITILFVGGLLLELIGAYMLSTIHDGQSGISLCVAGFAAVITAILLRRRRSKKA